MRQSIRRSVSIPVNGNTPTFDQQILKLFANGEQGFYYDPNDLSTMFQDDAGIVPVTTAGQPVGLMLDKSKGLVRGVDRVDEQDLSKWSSGGAYGNWPGSTATFDTVTSTSPSAFGARSRRFAINGGQAFEASALVKCLTADSVDISLVFGTVGGVYITERPVRSGAIEFSKVSLRTVAPDNAASCEITIKVRGATGVTAQVKDISVKQVLGNHAYQSTSASRPILRKNAETGANYLEFDGSDDFLQTSNINFTGTDKVTSITAINSSVSTRCVFETGTDITTTDGTFGLFRGGLLQFGARGTVYRLINIDAVGIPEVLVVKADIGNATLSINQNGQPLSTMNQSLGVGKFGDHPLYIGRRGGTSLPFNGHIYSLIGIGKLTTDSETVAIEKELAKRVGVALNV